MFKFLNVALKFVIMCLKQYRLPACGHVCSKANTGSFCLSLIKQIELLLSHCSESCNNSENQIQVYVLSTSHTTNVSGNIQLSASKAMAVNITLSNCPLK
ncbi:hypothetical protein ACOSQ3_022622 [Xanthoceras sorbifolium]